MTSSVILDKIPKARANPFRASKHEPRIYFAACAGYIKIGTSINVRARLTEISCYTPSDLELIGTVEGGLAVERQIHEQLTAFHHRREWFVDCTESRAAITRIMKADAIVQRDKNAAGSIDPAVFNKLADPSTSALYNELLKVPAAELAAFSERAGVDLRTIARARCGNRIRADYYLRICAALGFDPVKRLPIPMMTIGRLDRRLLATAVRDMREKYNHTLRDMECAGVSYSSIWRLERADVTAIDTILIACRFLSLNPFDYAPADVSRERTETPLPKVTETRRPARPFRTAEEIARSFDKTQPSLVPIGT